MPLKKKKTKIKKKTNQKYKIIFTGGLAHLFNKDIKDKTLLNEVFKFYESSKNSIKVESTVVDGPAKSSGLLNKSSGFLSKSLKILMMIIS